jgi:hypothetical protein
VCAEPLLLARAQRIQIFENFPNYIRSAWPQETQVSSLIFSMFFFIHPINQVEPGKINLNLQKQEARLYKWNSIVKLNPVASLNAIF